MTWPNRLKLLVGSVAVLALVAGLTLLFNQRQHTVTTSAAAIAAAEYPVGSDYAGTVTAVHVKQGQTVRAGDRLVSVQSGALLHDLEQKVVTRAALGYTVSKKGLITFRAPVSGTVTGLQTRAGAFVAAGSALLTVDRAGSLFVTARVRLSPTDYARLHTGAPVDLMLPNQRTVTGHVSDIAVTTAEGVTQADLKVVSGALVEGGDNGLVVPGTPVTSSVHLRDDGPLAGVHDRVSAFLRRIGL